MLCIVPKKGGDQIIKYDINHRIKHVKTTSAAHYDWSAMIWCSPKMRITRPWNVINEPMYFNSSYTSTVDDVSHQLNLAHKIRLTRTQHFVSIVLCVFFAHCIQFVCLFSLVVRGARVDGHTPRNDNSDQQNVSLFNNRGKNTGLFVRRVCIRVRVRVHCRLPEQTDTNTHNWPHHSRLRPKRRGKTQRIHMISYIHDTRFICCWLRDSRCIDA